MSKSAPSPSPPPPLLGFVCGTVSGVLTYFTGDNIAAALLAGLAAGAGATAFLHTAVR